MASKAVNIIEGGKIAIPSSLRKEVGFNNGDTVVVSASDGSLHIRSLASAIKQAQAMMLEIVPAGVSLVDELIDDRRAEAKREENHGCASC